MWLKGTLFILFSVFLSCIGICQVPGFPVYKDTFSQKGKSKAATGMEMRERQVQYLGPYKDTIVFRRINDSRVPIGENKVLIDDSVHKKFSYLKNLKIIVDPSKQVTLEEFEWWVEDGGYKYYKAYPILISNESDSTSIVGYGYNIP